MDTPTTRIITPARVVALTLIAVLVGGLAYARFGTDAEAISVTAGAEAGDLILEPCEYTTEDGAHAADCGTLVVPENRADPQSRLIALPVTRIHARSENPAEPIFYLQGGPGIPNDFDDPSYAARFTDSRDVVLVGYRGVEGSSVLECPEVSAAMTRSSDLVDEASLQRFGDALIACADRLGEEGVDLDGYTLTQRVEDMEAVRAALGHDRVNLLSESAGTRTAMIYAWRHPESIHRSVMIGVNPPGHYLWDPKTTDDQLHHYADLCSKDEACRRRTEDLAGTIREVAADMPERWLFLPINEGNVKAGSFYGLMETSSAAAPLNAPMILDAWLSAADGDPSGLWLQSFVMSALYPDKAWGEQAATGIIDAPYAEEYYASGGDPGSILGNAATDFMWAGGLLTNWPAGPDDTEYRHVQPSDVETLLIGGTLDFSTPPGNATDELLPFLSNGHQVVLTDFGHTTDFWTYQPEAANRLINVFFDTGEVDDSRYVYQAVDFTPESTHTAMAKIVAGAMIGVAVLALVLLLWMPRHVRKRGSFGPITGAVFRTVLVPLVLGLGGWFLAGMIVQGIWPAIPFADPLLVTVSVGVSVGIGSYWAWVRRDWPAKSKWLGLAAAAAGALAGTWLGFHATAGLLAPLTAIAGAVAGGNLTLILLDMSRAPTVAANEATTMTVVDARR